MQQARECGPARLQQVEEIRRNDPKTFSLMILEFRSKQLVWQSSE